MLYVGYRWVKQIVLALTNFTPNVPYAHSMLFRCKYTLGIIVYG